jgi:signal transduction histidine kinase
VGFASLLRKDLEGDAKKKELVEKILAGTKDLNSFITNLLDFARPLKVVRKKEDFSEVLERAIAFSLSSARSGIPHRVRVRKTYRDRISHETDGQLLFRLLLNVLINAFEAMDGRGTCDVSLERVERLLKQKKAQKTIRSINCRDDGPFALFVIRDKGPGIEKKFMDEMFKPFVTTKSYGTGLGLAMVQKIIDALSGRIDVNSREGKGTELRIFIPLG